MFNFTPEMVKAMELFIKNRRIRVAYYVGVGVAYLFAFAALVHAIRWW